MADAVSLPVWGDEAKALWPLERDMIFLNHGSYGAAPRRVLEAQARWQAKLEAQPCQFISHIAPAEIRRSADTLAQFLGASGDELALVENTTCGVNAILRSLSFGEGDEVVVSDHVYNAVRNTLLFLLEPVGARLVVAEVGLPVTDPSRLADAVVEAITPRTKLVVIDHVASISAVIFPVAEIARRAAERGVPVLVDGAHAPGMLDLDVPSLGAAYYVGNCHKWLCAPKGAAFLWARAPERAALHPTVISHDLGKGFTFEFDKIGTRDATAWMAVPEALAFHAEQGGPALRKRNHDVVVSAAEAVAQRFGTEMGAPADCFGSMATIRVPGDLPADRPTAEAIKAWAWANRRAEVHVMPFGGALWLRFSVQAYNTAEECLAAAEIVLEATAALTPRA